MKLIHYNVGGNDVNSHQVYFEEYENDGIISNIKGCGNTKEEAIRDYRKKLRNVCDDIEYMMYQLISNNYDMVEKYTFGSEPFQYKDPTIVPVEKFFITKENFNELIPVYTEYVRRIVRMSYEFHEYVKYVGAKKILFFPIPLSTIIEMTILGHMDKGRTCILSPMYISKYILDETYKNKIPYLKIMPYDNNTQFDIETLLYHILHSPYCDAEKVLQQSPFKTIKDRLVMNSTELIQRAETVYGKDVVDSQHTRNPRELLKIYVNLTHKATERMV